MEFSVILRQAVELPDLQQRMQTVFQEILNVPFIPSIKRKEQTVIPHRLNQVGDTVVFFIDPSAEAQAMVLDLPSAETDPYVTQPTVVISTGTLRTETSWVLVIILAIALAQTIEGTIIDDALLLSNTMEAHPTQLLESLMLPERQDDLLQASHELLKKLDLL